MAKFKKPILLQEEFAAGEVSSNPTTPAVKTTVDTVGTEQVAADKSGEQVRAEIVQDVDTILTNLEQLSKQITESIDAIIEEVFTEDFELLTEADAGATLMAMFKAGAASAKLNAMYPKLYKKKKKAELDKVLFGFKFDADKEERVAQAVEKIKDKINDKISKLEDPAAKQKARISRDKTIETMKAQATKKLEREKTDQATKQDRAIADIGTKITKLLADNKVGDSPAISAQWDSKKLKIEREADDDFLKKERKIQDEFIEDEDRLKRLEKAAADRNAKEVKAEAEASKKIAERSKQAAADLEAQIAGASDTEKEALKKVQTYMKGISEFGAATGALAADPQNKELAKEAKTKLSELKAAYKAIGKSDYASAFGYSGDSKEADIIQAQKEYSDRVDTMESKYDEIDAPELEDEKDLTKSAEDVAKEKLGDNFDAHTKITNKDEREPETTDDAGNTVPGKKKWMNAQTFTGKDKEGKDTEEVVMYALPNDNQSAATVDGTDINEGVHAKIKKAMKAVEGGETVYGENVRFPGRFKIVSFNKDGSMANVDYEDGTDAFDMAAMNIAIDKLQFEAVEVEETEEVEEGNEFGAARAEAIAKGEKTFKVGDEEYPVEDVSKDDKENAKEFVEEAKEELPKKIKLYEGMSVANKFKALM